MTRAAWLLLLVGSLAANGFLFARWQARTAPIIAATSAGSRPAPASRAPAIAPHTWEKLRFPEPATLVAEMRARGFPPAVMRAIVAEHLRERFADRYSNIAAAIDAAPYWNSALTYETPQLAQARRTLSRDVADAMRDLLGADASDLVRLRRRYGDHAPDKLLALERIHADYGDLTNDVQATSRGLMLASDRAQLALLEKEKRDDLARLLGPEGMETVELQSSPAASDLRSRLIAFEPSEQEFRALFRLRQESAALFEAASSLTPPQRADLSEDARAFRARLTAALGPERFADYQRKTDPAWVLTTRFVAREGLPPASTVALVALRSEFEQRETAIRDDATLNLDQRRSRLDALASEASARLLPMLGPQRLDAYRQAAPGLWLNQLQFRTRPTPTR